MFPTSKQLQVPANIQIRTDSHRNIHMTLACQNQTQNSNTNKVVEYIYQLLECQLKGNQQQNKKYLKMTRAIWLHLKFSTTNETNQNKNIKSSNTIAAELLGILCSDPKLNFTIHHGYQKDISLYKWLTDQIDLVPPYSMFYVSCGAVIIQEDHILLVQQKNGARNLEYGIPGGRADFGQSLKKCVERQLFQETGIIAQYKYIVQFRQLSNTLFGGSDIYFACLVSPSEGSKSLGIKKVSQMIKLCERELNAYKWVHLKQYKQFTEKNSVGSQIQLSKYITELYEKGFDFQKQVPNKTLHHQVVSKRDGIQREFIQHLLSG